MIIANFTCTDSSLEQCGWLETYDHEQRFDPRECGEQCMGNPFTKNRFYCKKHEICCPSGYYGEKCSTRCGPYKLEGNNR